MQGPMTGGLLLVLAGVMNGSFALPMKRMPQWNWENIWLVWSVASLIVMPLVTTLICVPHLFSGLGEVPPSTLLPVAFFGLVWGIAQVLFGLSVATIGIALTFSLVLGISAALGAMVPFLRFHMDLLWARPGTFLFVGLAVLSLGMVFCGRAGILRERTMERKAAAMPFSLGLAMAILSGLCASAMNIGFSYSKDISTMALRHGASPAGGAMAGWRPWLTAGSIPNLVYTVHLLRKRRATALYVARDTGTYWMLTTCMAVLWFASTMLYGIASSMLGDLGAVLGWPVFMSIVVLVASLLGWISGEWKSSGTRPLRVQIAGMAMLVVAVFLFAKALV